MREMTMRQNDDDTITVEIDGEVAGLIPGQLDVIAGAVAEAYPDAVDDLMGRTVLFGDVTDGL